MKNTLIRLCWPVLQIFEKGQEAYVYKPSHRKALVGVGMLFLFLAVVSLYFSFQLGGGGGIVPAIVFLAASITSLIVGALGSERAVAKIWGSKPGS